jgi:hypothetical protein
MTKRESHRRGRMLMRRWDQQREAAINLGLATTDHTTSPRAVQNNCPCNHCKRGRAVFKLLQTPEGRRAYYDAGIRDWQRVLIARDSARRR